MTVAFQEYPKWIGNVVFNDATEEAAHLATLGACVDATPIAPVQSLPSPAAIRMRRTRERQRENKRVILCDISEVQIEAMVMAGFLDPVRRNDAAEVARGVGHLLDRVVTAGWLK